MQNRFFSQRSKCEKAGAGIGVAIGLLVYLYVLATDSPYYYQDSDTTILLKMFDALFKMLSCLIPGGALGLGAGHYTSKLLEEIYDYMARSEEKAPLIRRRPIVPPVRIVRQPREILPPPYSLHAPPSAPDHSAVIEHKIAIVNTDGLVNNTPSRYVRRG